MVTLINEIIAIIQSKRTWLTALFVTVIMLLGPYLGIDASEDEVSDVFVRLFDAAIEVLAIALAVAAWVVSDGVRPVQRKTSKRE